MASLRHRREMAEAEDFDDGHDNSSRSSGTAADSATEEEQEEHLGLHSMTAKGIQHLCSELLEIKKASEQDFRTNVYLSYLSFLRMFQEAGDLEKDLHGHVLAHRRLVDHLSHNLYSPSIAQSSSSRSGSSKDAAIPDPEDEELESWELDVLLSEHRMEQALELLELQGQRMQQIATSAEAIALSMAALSARKARVADRFASVADNPRTPRGELLESLSGLCKLGEAQRANHLLFKFYRPKTKFSSSIKDLACMVFSSIVEASRSFIALHGHPSPHTPQLIRWAREEMEDFGVAFSEYVKEVVGQHVSVVPALEAAKCALSSCSLLRPLHIVSEQDLMDLIVPCLQELLTMHARHLKDVTRLFVASDSWELGRFPVSGILFRAGSPATAGLHNIDYCLLTTSGRKFVTLIQEVVEEVYPLLHLRMKNSVLQLLAELFGEYMHSIVELIPRKEGATAKDQQYMWQLSILINCTTLVSLFPIIAQGIFKSDSPSVADVSTQGELDNMILLIKEASGQVWTCFCQQFIRDTMSDPLRVTESGASLSPQGMMPSFAFQVLFLRVRQLNNLYGTILTGKDGSMKKLLQELMEAMIFWLSNNLDSWIHHAQDVPRDTFLQQIQLDVHFLLEFAQFGGFYSEDIRTGALDLLTKAEEKVPHDNRNSGNRQEGWATDVAKHAVGVLMATMSSPGQEASVQNIVVAQEGEEMNPDVVASSEEGPKEVLDTICISAPDEDLEKGAWDGGKSSDEFVSIEEDDEDGIMSSEELKHGLDSSHQVAPDEVSEIDPTAEVWEDHQKEADDNADADDHESGSSAEMCRELDAIEVEEEELIGDHDDSSCELVLRDNTPIQGTAIGGGGGITRWRRQASTAPPPPPAPPAEAASAAEKGARSSRKKREATSRSSRPRWQ
ncbi:hypothetical protein EJB05_47577, partial [Eragrostis curvula]